VGTTGPQRKAASVRAKPAAARATAKKPTPRKKPVRSASVPAKKKAAPRPKKPATPRRRPAETVAPPRPSAPPSTTVTVGVDDMRTKPFPPVCAITGEPSDKSIRLKAAYTPAWAYLFVLLGVLPGILIVIAIQNAYPHARLRLPVSRSYTRRYSLYNAIGAFGIFAWPTLLIVGAVDHSVGLAVSAVIPFAAMIVGFVLANTKRVKATVEAGNVVLRPVHPAFVEACAAEGLVASEVAPVEEPALRTWNWGAFLLGWVWGLGNGVWIALLDFIPVVGIGVRFYLGARGNELAWKQKSAGGADRFIRTQRNWRIGGVIAWGVTLSLLVPFIIAAASHGPAPLKTSAFQRYVAGEPGVVAGQTDGFSVEFPVPPTADTLNDQVQGRPLAAHLLNAAVGDVVFQVSYVDLPASNNAVLPHFALQRGASADAASVTNGKLTRYQELTLGANMAADYAFTGDAVYGEGRIVLTRKRVYAIRVLSRAPDPAGGKRFIASFKVLSDAAAPGSS
jgi:hypothetical protein